jgi:hypothetical protein
MGGMPMKTESENTERERAAYARIHELEKKKAELDEKISNLFKLAYGRTNAKPASGG